MNINEKQTPVSPNLLWDLYPELYDRNDQVNGYKVRISEFSKIINESVESALYGKIKYPSTPTRSKSKAKIGLNTICKSIKDINLIGNGGISSGFLINTLIDRLNIKNKDVERYSKEIIFEYFKASKSISKKNWDIPKSAFYCTNQYIGSFLILFESIFNYIIDKKEIAKEDDIKYAQVLFMKYLRPAQNFIDKMTEKELYDFKIGKLGGGGPKGIFSELINVIGEVYNDFEEDRRKNKEQEETFDNIFNSLIENGEK